MRLRLLVLLKDYILATSSCCVLKDKIFSTGNTKKKFKLNCKQISSKPNKNTKAQFVNDMYITVLLKPEKIRKRLYKKRLHVELY